MDRRTEIIERLKSEIIILDGAMGTELQRRGMPSGVCPEVWAMENPGVLKDIQGAYKEAGAGMVYSCTFGGNPVKLAEFGYENAEEINESLVRICREAVGPDVLIAGDISSTGRFVEPFGDFPFDEAVESFRRQVRGLKAGGVDLFVIETQIDIQEARAALIAVKEETDDFALVTMTFEADGRTLNGTTPEAAIITLQSLGADAVGINCSTGPAEMLRSIGRMAEVARVPLAAKPNAGMPRIVDGKTVFPMGAEDFAGYARDFRDAGVSFFGGCCGTTPEHIAAVHAFLKGVESAPACRDWDAPENSGVGGARFLLSSAREALISGPNSPLGIIGEKINPTGKTDLQAELKAGEYSWVGRTAREQEGQGAALLDVNVGMPGIDESRTMRGAISALAPRCGLPLVIDSSDPTVVEAAVRLYPGRALINSISGETEKMKRLIPVVEKYGSAFILLPLADSELPLTADRRMEIVHEVYSAAKKAGAGKYDILVDGLVMTVSSKPEAAAETLKTIRRSSELGFGAVAGLSNVSFGLPSREWLNSGLLAMAQVSGMNFVIANAGDPVLMNIKTSGDLLLGRDPRGKTYIDRFGRENGPGTVSVGSVKAGTGSSVSKAGIGETGAESLSPEGQVFQAVLDGEGERLLAALEICLEAGMAPEALLKEQMIPAILKTGELYDQKKYYLPQLMASAEAMRDGFTRLEPILVKEGTETARRIVFATVQGDIHDIGKNIVILMLRNYGFEVVDLGKDVAVETIVTAVKEHSPDILGLSALMTTTMVRMPEVVARLKEEGIAIPVMVGGAVVTSEWAQSIGAHFSRDGVEAVRVADELIKTAD